MHKKIMTLSKPSAPKGFTLAELLITVTILVILGLALLIGINPLVQIFKGYDARRKADLYKLRTAFESYYIDHDCYPSADILSQCGSNALEPYLPAIPCDPDGSPYSIKIIPDNSICPQQYAIYSNLVSPLDKAASKYKECPQVIAVTSPSITYIDTISGCSIVALCHTYYGCQDGFCTAVTRDSSPTCAPNYCYPDCGGVNCAKMARGKFINQCVAF